MLEARIHVTLKKSVLDPQGDTVKSGLASLGFTSVEDCRIGKFMVVKLSETDQTKAKAQVDEMCRKLLANPVIEDYVFQVSEVAGGSAGCSSFREPGAIRTLPMSSRTSSAATGATSGTRRPRWQGTTA